MAAKKEGKIIIVDASVAACAVDAMSCKCTDTQKPDKNITSASVHYVHLGRDNNNR